MIRVADYVARGLAAHGIRHVFLVTGGAAMHLNDAIGRCHDLSYVCFHHEQAAAMAAQGYYRLTNRLAAVNVTAGPGSTNAITGVFGAWVDSLGMVVVSGQVKWETLVRSTDLPLRQLGDQEVDIVRLVEPITKYAVLVTEPQSIRYHLEKALHLAQTGRPGPVWLDIPGNVQSAMIEPETLEGFTPDWAPIGTTDVTAACAEISARLKAARSAGPPGRCRGPARPSGGRVPPSRRASRDSRGDRIQRARPAADGRSAVYRAPGHDRRPGRQLRRAERRLSSGARLPAQHPAGELRLAALRPAAFKVMVDIDAAELKKPTIDARSAGARRCGGRDSRPAGTARVREADPGASRLARVVSASGRRVTRWCCPSTGRRSGR